jgi:hypothetical protein
MSLCSYFCEHIIKKELMALTSKTPHPPATWVVPALTVSAGSEKQRIRYGTDSLSRYLSRLYPQDNVEGLPLLGRGRLPEKRSFALDVKHVA